MNLIFLIILIEALGENQRYSAMLPTKKSLDVTNDERLKIFLSYIDFPTQTKYSYILYYVLAGIMGS